MRRQTNRAVSIRVDNRDARTESLMNMVNEPQFANQMKIAVDDPKSLEASNVKKHILPLLKTVGSKVKWSPIERKATLSRHYALYHALGMPFLFGTISPEMRNSPLALRMCLNLSKIKLENKVEYKSCLKSTLKIFIAGTRQL